MTPSTAKNLVTLIESEKQRFLSQGASHIPAFFEPANNTAGTELFLFTPELEKACLAKGIPIRDIISDGYLYLDLAFRARPERWNGNGERFSHPHFDVSFKGYSGPTGLFNKTKNDKTRGLFDIKSAKDGASLDTLRYSQAADADGGYAPDDAVLIDYGRIKQLAAQFKSGGQEK